MNEATDLTEPICKVCRHSHLTHRLKGQAILCAACGGECAPRLSEGSVRP